MQTVYNFKGTPDELIIMTKQGFGIDKTLSENEKIEEEKAKFLVSLLLPEEQSDYEGDFDSEIAMWQMADESMRRFQTPIWTTRFNISFTEIGKQIADMLFDIIATLKAEGKGDNVYILLFKCAKALYKSIDYIDKSDCCVYYQALKWKADHPTQEFFRVGDILPQENEGYCSYIDKIEQEEWKCGLYHKEMCKKQDDLKKHFTSVLKRLESQNVLISYDTENFKFKI